MPDTIAAIDLGSNSFHMLVAKPTDDGFMVIDSDKEMVRLAAGLQKDRSISEEVTQRALECLSRFGQRLKHITPGQVRIVGTNTLRASRGSQAFIREAEKLLGHPLNIISGIEEARLIYLGVAHSIAGDEGRRLVVDIGGGSTELIIGERFNPLQMESLYMGCVSMSQRFFSDGKISTKRINKARLAALVELEPHIERYKSMSWQDSIGASGTIRAIESVAMENGWSRDGITAESLDKILKALKDFGSTDKINLPGLKKERVPVFIGGLIVLHAVFEALEIKSMMVASGALREGLLYDLIGQEQQEGTRSNAINALAGRYNVDQHHAARVEETAILLFNQVKNDWNLDTRIHEYSLRWAARVHEVGLSIAHSQHHKHAGYILRNSDLPGFSRQEQQILAALVQTHRRSLDLDIFNELSDEWRQKAIQLAVILRMAVILHRGRHPEAITVPSCKVHDSNEIELVFNESWLESRPLTTTDLQEEHGRLTKSGISLIFS
ncbi:MAG: exopolyphosphatase [Gammaproteobacteria bacterium]|nr:exopolyphosphatase [Gammaproteobacteria bacterium]